MHDMYRFIKRCTLQSSLLQKDSTLQVHDLFAKFSLFSNNKWITALQFWVYTAVSREIPLKKIQLVLLTAEIYTPALCICQYITLKAYLVICRTARHQSSGKHTARKKESSFQKEEESLSETG